MAFEAKAINPKGWNGRADPKMPLH